MFETLVQEQALPFSIFYQLLSGLTRLFWNTSFEWSQ